ncbi:MAG: ATP-binding domain-containing protein, partial [Pseudonocardiaceae bacterium]
LEQLTINYRNPAEIAELANEVLAALDVDITPPQSVRRTGVAPRAVRVAALPDELPAVVAEEAAAVGDGRVAVLGAAIYVDKLRKLLAAVGGDQGLSAGSAGPGPIAGSAGLDAPVTVLTVTQAKGLEFDAVVLVDPAAILAESPRGLNDLYVALTRSTQRLCIVHSGELPEVLAKRLPDTP